MMQANMRSRRLGYVLPALGAAVAASCWLADALRSGSHGVRAVPLALAGLPDARRVPRPLLAAALITVASAAYAAVLVPFAYRPPYLANSFPLLLLILLTMTALGTMKDGAVVDRARGAQEPGAA